MSNNKIIISGHHVDLTQGMKDHVEKKLSHLFDHNTITNINVILDIEKDNHIAEATVHIPGHNTLHAKATTGDMYSSIDELEHKIDSQLKKEHSKEANHHKEAPKKGEY
jgi:putative sigma-54 modulation protein